MSKTERREQTIESLFQQNKVRLEQIAHRAVNEFGNDPNSVVVLCIDVEDPAWTELVDFLMPGYDWQSIRDQGQKPVARGWKPASFMIDVVGTAVPAIKDALNVVNANGEVTTVVMAGGGASVYWLNPNAQLRLG